MTTTTTPGESVDYCRDYLPPNVVEKLQAGAFRQLCQHLQERSDQVQNIELMTLSGFCRNCLAKVSSGVEKRFWKMLSTSLFLKKLASLSSSLLPLFAVDGSGSSQVGG